MTKKTRLREWRLYVLTELMLLANTAKSKKSRARYVRNLNEFADKLAAAAA